MGNEKNFVIKTYYNVCVYGTGGSMKWHKKVDDEQVHNIIRNSELVNIYEYCTDREVSPLFNVAPYRSEESGVVSGVAEKLDALDVQIGGTHYKKLKIQPIQAIHENDLDFFQGNITKYAWRHKDKHGVEDLKKVIHYAQLAAKFQYGVDL